MCSNLTVWYINMLYQYIWNNEPFWEDKADESKRINLPVSTQFHLYCFPPSHQSWRKIRMIGIMSIRVYFTETLYGSCIKRELKGSGNLAGARLIPLPGQMKNSRNQKESTPVSHSLLKKNSLRDTGNSKVPLLLWHQKFPFKRRRVQSCLFTLVLHFSQDFSVLICVRQDYLSFWQTWVVL